jgi:hypothetical protein
MTRVLLVAAMLLGTACSRTTGLQATDDGVDKSAASSLELPNLRYPQPSLEEAVRERLAATSP